MKFFTWRSAILDSDLASTTKLVLLVISTYMDDHGGGAFPSTLTISEKAGLSERAVCTHIEKAREAGFITSHKEKKRGRDWARNSYRIAFPDKPGTEPDSVAESDAQNSEGTEPDSVPCSQAPETQAVRGLQGQENEALNDVQYQKRGTEPHARGTEPHARGTERRSVYLSKELSKELSSKTPASTTLPREAFAMHPDWMPEINRFEELMTLRGITREMFSLEALHEFVGFWVADGRVFRQEQWEHKLASSLIEYEAKRKRREVQRGTPSAFGETYAARQAGGAHVDS
ncbi:DnaT-like ssDNA-binding domain-containing protein [Spongiibacter sp. UBA1325]|uniref:DnaT-like ssDNA-binding domain-containing protein n=1 Tax=Spongiibacter sp. UBA1325 TaxID=1947543 RepID=UPI002579E80E|nr:DnaT-like ssDNA-binding domain-containing protein [Spongiibacter sp. UBA1325]